MKGWLVNFPSLLQFTRCQHLKPSVIIRSLSARSITSTQPDSSRSAQNLDKFGSAFMQPDLFCLAVSGQID
jgi:hypothetical protein